MSICRKQQQVTLEAQFMKKLSNIETELKESVAYKNTCIRKRTHFLSKL